MYAIIVTVLPPTNTKPIRYRASAANGQTVVCSAPMNDVCPFASAAKKFAEINGWRRCGKWVSGSIENGMVFIAPENVADENTFTVEN
jgi:hypothetical protein